MSHLHSEKLMFSSSIDIIGNEKALRCENTIDDYRFYKLFYILKNKLII